MNDRLMKMIEKFNALAIRMRILFTLVAIMLVAMIVDSLWIAENFNQVEKLSAEIVQTENRINDLIRAQNELNNNVVKQRNHPLLKQLNQVEKQIEKSKLVLEEKTINLVKPESMSKVLGDIILRSKNLKLISLTKQAPQALFENGQSEKSENPKVQIYRHLVELVLEGQYKDTQRFLSLIEDMPQKLNFESFEYEVKNYPQSKVKLVVSTLSLDRKWIGG
jgi:MSHA biogenesis protein MshJ